MSYTELFKFKANGDAERFNEVSNSWRGAMAVWNFLEEKYLPKKQFGRMITNEMQEVWDLIEDDRLTEYEKICLQTTFDNVLVKRKHLPKLIEAFRNFEGESSLPEQADLIEEELKIDDTFLAIGWNQTSVNGDTWENFGEYNEDTEEYAPYNIFNMTRHWFMFTRTIKDIQHLEKLIRENIISFDKFIRDNFYTGNLNIDKKVIDYDTNDMSVFYDDNFISIEMHSCAEIQDSINIRLTKDDEDENYKEMSWLDATIYAYQYIDEMD